MNVLYSAIILYKEKVYEKCIVFTMPGFAICKMLQKMDFPPPYSFLNFTVNNAPFK